MPQFIACKVDGVAEVNPFVLSSASSSKSSSSSISLLISWFYRWYFQRGWYKVRLPCRWFLSLLSIQGIKITVFRWMVYTLINMAPYSCKIYFPLFVSHVVGTSFYIVPIFFTDFTVLCNRFWIMSADWAFEQCCFYMSDYRCRRSTIWALALCVSRFWTLHASYILPCSFLLDRQLA